MKELIVIKSTLKVCGVFALAAVPSFATVYNAVTDFPTGITSSTSPQSGPWSYGNSTTLNPVNFSLDTTATGDYFGDGNAAGFYTPTGGYMLPTVLKNVTGSTIPVEDGTIGPWPANLLLMHPGPTGDYSVVQFTAASAATYVVTGEYLAIGNNTGQTSDSVSITTSGPASTTIIGTASTNVPFTFSFSQYLAAGQSLDFAVGLGPESQFYYDSTGFDATISATPEPGFYGALALGLTGLVTVLRRRKLS
jgi:hypothetical protein